MIHSHRTEPEPLPAYAHMWNKETAYIVGGGPSLRGFDWSLLKDKHVIAINRAYEAVPNAEVLFWMDDAFFAEHSMGLEHHKAKYKISVSPLFLSNDRSKELGVTLLYWEGLRGLAEDVTKVCTGKNSGYAAINLAFHFGVSKIVLLGYDMCEDTGVSHWHSGYTYNYRPRKLLKYLPWFSNLVGPLKRWNVEVVNACPGSLLDCFPKATLEEVFLE